MNEMRNYAIVGAGWLGLPLAEYWTSLGYTVHGTTRSAEKMIELEKRSIHAHQFTQESMLDPQRWLNDMDVVVIAIPPSDFGEEYVKYVKAIASNISDTAKVVFVSSTSVYADENTQIDEDTATRGEGRNGPAIIAAEEQLRIIFENRLTIIRMSGLVGGQRHPIRFMAGRTISNGLAPVNLIHLDDCVGLITWVVDTDFFGKTVNGVTQEHPSKEDYYAFAAQELKLNPPTFIQEKSSFKIVSSKWNKINQFYHYMYRTPFEFPLS